MAANTLPAFPPPIFPQLIPSLLDREIARVDQILARAELVCCCFDRCHERATVQEIETGLEFCLRHFEDTHRQGVSCE